MSRFPGILRQRSRRESGANLEASEMRALDLCCTDGLALTVSERPRVRSHPRDNPERRMNVRRAARESALEGLPSEQFVLQVGPSSVALKGRLDPNGWPLDAAHHRFICPTAELDLTLRVRHGRSGVPRGKLAFRAGGVAAFYRDGAAWAIHLGENEDSSSADRMVSLDISGTTGTLVMDLDRSPDLAGTYPLQYPLEDLLFRHLLAEHHALLVHACGVAWQGRGYLFIGSSGSGKSTTARLWKAAGSTVLNDDRVVLHASPDGVFIHPTPWFGDYPDVGAEAVPLAGLYLLQKGSEVAFEPIRSARAAALLFAKSFPPLWDPERMARTLETLDLVCQQVPCAWLTVPPDQRALAWVQAH